MKIKSITSAGKEDVYNICVDKYHNFVLANGIVVKNCDAVRYLLSGRPCPKVESNIKVSTLPYALRTEADNPPQEYWEQTANIKEESYW